MPPPLTGRPADVITDLAEIASEVADHQRTAIEIVRERTAGGGSADQGVRGPRQDQQSGAGRRRGSRNSPVLRLRGILALERRRCLTPAPVGHRKKPPPARGRRGLGSPPGARRRDATSSGKHRKRSCRLDRPCRVAVRARADHVPTRPLPHAPHACAARGGERDRHRVLGLARSPVLGASPRILRPTHSSSARGRRFLDGAPSGADARFRGRPGLRTGTAFTGLSSSNACTPSTVARRSSVRMVRFASPRSTCWT